MKAVSAQCPTVGNQKNTMKKKKNLQSQHPETTVNPTGLASGPSVSQCVLSFPLKCAYTLI